MRTLSMLILGLALATGCGKGGIDGKLDELSKMKDEACACKDKACADAAHEKFTTWNKGMKSEHKDDKPSDAQMKKYEELRTAMRECRNKFDTAMPDGSGMVPTPVAPAGSAAAPATP